MDTDKKILDACCDSRMFWFDRTDSRALFVDKRRESHVLPDKSSKGGFRRLEINPDVVADFTNLPFQECFRVLQPNGVLIFKWNENEISVSEILKLTTEHPLIGNRYYESHWIVFMKPA
ncbi:MAG: SAM-dependent methyltransferase [Patescibacteria group bacterium]|nr:SAM-dependent methyltransferase [Patescibacteria group bacterium]